jgi:hypothetical protein
MNKNLLNKGPEYTLKPVITLRQYYIAHAPKEPQMWFKPKMPIARPEPIMEAGSPLNFKELFAWDDEYTKQLHIQWPAAWADAMIEHEKGKKTHESL